jgi:hypothetical protein
LIEIFRGSSREFFGRNIDLLWDFGGLVGFDCCWTGLEWKIDESFRGLDFFPVGGLKLNSKSVAKCFFLTSGITHKIPDKNSLFSSSSVPRNENEISWEFLNNFFDKF